LRNAKGENSTAELRLSMQKTMQSKCAVFRTEKILKKVLMKLEKLMMAWTLFQLKIDL
jgi:succinate dehydrogenase / fumarate reductase flavoprotein subunit